MKGLYVLFMLVIASRNVCCSRITPNTDSTFDVLTYGAIGDGQTDDSNAFLKAFNDACGTTEGTPAMTIPEGKTFLLQPLVFKGPCKSTNIIVELKGNITAPTDIGSWNFTVEKQRKIWIQFSKISGLVVNGEGNIDGQGSPWWDKFGGKGQEKFRPTALRFLDCEALTLSNLNHMNSPKNHISVDSCKNASISNLHITAPPTSPNTDGIDISESTNISIMNSTIETGDDCIAINNGSSVITITGIFCGPGHGISVGSLGKDNSYATVEDVRVQNCTFTGTSNGGRIKTFEGGSGYARNITYEDIILNEVKHPVIIDQEYKPNADSAVEISDVTYSNIRGTSAGEYAIELKCELNIGCTNIVLDHINITRADGGKAGVVCVGGHGNSSSCNPVVPCLKNVTDIWY